jgi:hypothetical protein
MARFFNKCVAANAFQASPTGHPSKTTVAHMRAIHSSLTSLNVRILAERDGDVFAEFGGRAELDQGSVAIHSVDECEYKVGIGDAATVDFEYAAMIDVLRHRFDAGGAVGTDAVTGRAVSASVIAGDEERPAVAEAAAVQGELRIEELAAPGCRGRDDPRCPARRDPRASRSSDLAGEIDGRLGDVDDRLGDPWRRDYSWSVHNPSLDLVEDARGGVAQ